MVTLLLLLLLLLLLQLPTTAGVQPRVFPLCHGEPPLVRLQRQLLRSRVKDVPPVGRFVQKPDVLGPRAEADKVRVGVGKAEVRVGATVRARARG